MPLPSCAPIRAAHDALAVRRYALAPPTRLRAGTSIDAFLDESRIRRRCAMRCRRRFCTRSAQPWARRAGRDRQHAPGGDADRFQAGASRLDRAFAGKTILLSFVFTRCPDRTLCPAISGKYAYLQDRLDPKHFALAEITLDPPTIRPQSCARTLPVTALAARAGPFSLAPARRSSSAQRISDQLDAAEHR